MSAPGADPTRSDAAPVAAIPVADAPGAAATTPLRTPAIAPAPAGARERTATAEARAPSTTAAFLAAPTATPIPADDAVRLIAARSGAPAQHTAAPATGAPATPAPSGPSGIGFSGSFAPPGTAFFLAVLLAFCLTPCLRYGKVVLMPARWRPVLFVSLLERPG